MFLRERCGAAAQGVPQVRRGLSSWLSQAELECSRFGRGEVVLQILHLFALLEQRRSRRASQYSSAMATSYHDNRLRQSSSKMGSSLQSKIGRFIFFIIEYFRSTSKNCIATAARRETGTRRCYSASTVDSGSTKPVSKRERSWKSRWWTAICIITSNVLLAEMATSSFNDLISAGLKQCSWFFTISRCSQFKLKFLSMFFFSSLSRRSNSSVWIRISCATRNCAGTSCRSTISPEKHLTGTKEKKRS